MFELHLDEILEREPLGKYSREHIQGIKWLETDRGRLVPMAVVSGRRIAVIDPDGRALEAISVSHYDEIGGKVSAIAKPWTISVSLGLHDGVVVGSHQARRPDYSLSLEGKKVVGLTRREYGALTLIALSPPQHRQDGRIHPTLPPMYW